MTTKLIATIIRFICIGILLAGGFYFGQYFKECPPCSKAKTEPKRAFNIDFNYVVQEVFPLSDGRMNLTTRAWSHGEIIYSNHVSEHGQKEYWHKGNLWFVPKMTQEVKKAEYDRAQRALDAHLIYRNNSK